MLHDDPFLALLDARLAELERTQRGQGWWHDMEPVHVGPVPWLWRPDALPEEFHVADRDYGKVRFSSAQRQLIDEAVQRRIAELRATGEWQDGDHLVVRTLVEPMQQTRKAQNCPETMPPVSATVVVPAPEAITAPSDALSAAATPSMSPPRGRWRLGWNLSR